MAGERCQRHAEIGGNAEFEHGWVGADHGMRARIPDDQRLAAGDDMLAEGVAERRLPCARPWLPQSGAALEELPVGIDQRHQRHRNAQQAADQAGDAVERGVGRRIQKPGFKKRRPAFDGA